MSSKDPGFCSYYKSVRAAPMHRTGPRLATTTI